MRRVAVLVVLAAATAALLSWAGASASSGGEHRQVRHVRLVVGNGYFVDNDPSGQSGGDCLALQASCVAVEKRWASSRVRVRCLPRWVANARPRSSCGPGSDTACGQHSDSKGAQPALNRRRNRQVPRCRRRCQPSTARRPGPGPAAEADDRALAAGLRPTTDLARRGISRTGWNNQEGGRRFAPQASPYVQKPSRNGAVAPRRHGAKARQPCLSAGTGNSAYSRSPAAWRE